jgi:predicted dehydrogenase
VPLNLGIIGAGQVAQVHLAALRETEAVTVRGVFDADRARADAFARDQNIARVYPDFAAMLADSAVECVAVLLPHDLHERIAVQALQAGKHVVCEKPMGQNVAECRRMLDAAQAAGRTLPPVHNRIYSHAVELMHEIVSRGEIGEVILAQTNGFEGPRTVGVRPWLATGRAGGGVLMAQAVHPAYALRWLIGDIARVSCQFGDRRVVDMVNEDTAIATLKFANGALAEMTATFGIAHGPFDHSITLHGRDGYVNLTQMGVARDARQRYLLQVISPRRFGDTEMHAVEIAHPDSHVVGFRRMWEDYANGLTGGGETRVVGRDGLRAVEIIEAAYRSNATGRAIDLPLND